MALHRTPAIGAIVDPLNPLGLNTPNPERSISPTPLSIEGLASDLLQLRTAFDQLKDTNAKLKLEVERLAAELVRVNGLVSSAHTPPPSHLSNRVTELEGWRATTDSTLETIADRIETSPAAQPAAQTDPRMPDIPIFNGTTPLFQNWEIQRQDLFSVQKIRFQSAKTRTAYIGTLVSGPALEIYAGWRDAWKHKNTSNEDAATEAEKDLLARLAMAFDSSNRQTLARATMKTITQNPGENLRDFTIRWHPLRRDAGYDSDEAIIEDYMRSLQANISSQLRMNMHLKGIKSNDFTSITNEAILIDELRQVDAMMKAAKAPNTPNTAGVNGGLKARTPPPQNPPPGADTSANAQCWMHKTSTHTNKDCFVQLTRARQAGARGAAPAGGQGGRRVGAVGQEEAPAENGPALGDANPRA